MLAALFLGLSPPLGPENVRVHWFGSPFPLLLVRKTCLFGQRTITCILYYITSTVFSESVFGCIASDTNDWLPDYSSQSQVRTCINYPLVWEKGSCFVHEMTSSTPFGMQWQSTIASSLNALTNSAYLERVCVWRYVTRAAIQELLYHCNGQSMACTPIHSTVTTQLLPINTHLTQTRGLSHVWYLFSVLKKQNIHVHM